MLPPAILDNNLIRAQFSKAMSAMYRSEVPLYGALLELVSEVNWDYLAKNPTALDGLDRSGSLQSLSEERHGAIRLGTAQELHTMRRLFAVMGMQPVGYYDLTVAGIPVHSTAFRPVSASALAMNPFRVFTSLLRVDLIPNLELQTQIQTLLNQRQIFSPEALTLIELAEQQGGLTETQAEPFIQAALETFRWHNSAQVDAATYEQLNHTHRLVADIVSFKGPHINHLTPRTLDIDAVQAAMPMRAINPKVIVEGPPPRQYPILLRQTSFKALEEAILFQAANGATVEGVHTARFGEIEQRGAALTPKGRALYDQLLNQVSKAVPNPDANPDLYVQTLKQVFTAFPDDLSAMRRQGLAYFEYRLTAKKLTQTTQDPETLIEQGVIEAIPLTYEDFLPVSAAGIFRSNLGEGEQAQFNASANQQAFEQALGVAVLNEFEWYATAERESLQQCLTAVAAND